MGLAAIFPDDVEGTPTLDQVAGGVGPYDFTQGGGIAALADDLQRNRSTAERAQWMGRTYRWSRPDA